jgi:protein TonB
MTTTSQLEARVRALLRSDVQRARPRGPVRAAVAALGLSLGLLCATGQAIAQGENSPPPGGAEQPVGKPMVELPPPPEVQDPSAILLVLSKDGRVVHAGRDIGVEGVTALVRRRCEKGDCQVIIESAPDASASLLVRVVDHAKAGDAKRVAIKTLADAAASLRVVRGDTEAAAALRVVSGNAMVDAVPLASLDTEPRALHQPAPEVTAELRAHLPATVVVRFVVNEHGEVAAAEALQSTDARFREAVLDAVAKWRFEPGTRDCEPVPFRARVVIDLPADLSVDQPSAGGAGPEPTIVVPRLIRRVAPEVTPELRAHMPAIVWLAFLVDQQGRVKSQQVLKSTDARFEQAALDAVAKWRFEPGSRDGQRLVMEVRVPITFVEPNPTDPSPVLEGEMEKLDRKDRELRLEAEQRKSEPQGGSVRGVVLDGDSGVPLPGCEITVVETGQRVTTSDRGEYVFEKVVAGKYTLVFTKLGFRRTSKLDVLVSPGRPVDANATLIVRHR